MAIARRVRIAALLALSGCSQAASIPDQNPGPETEKPLPMTTPIAAEPPPVDEGHDVDGERATLD